MHPAYVLDEVVRLERLRVRTGKGYKVRDQASLSKRIRVWEVETQSDKLL